MSEKILQHLISNQRVNIVEDSKLGKLNKEKLEYILDRVDISNPDDELKSCWIWKGRIMYPNEKGHQHGVIWYKENYTFVHRMMYHNFIGHVPKYEHGSKNMLVNHTCNHENDGKCINPWHMYLGTPRQNTLDCINDGNLIVHVHTTLTPEVEERLKQLREDKKTIKDIAKELGVTTKTINRWISRIGIKYEKKYNDDLKDKVILEKLEGCEIKELTKKYGVSKNTILRWMREFSKEEGSETTMSGQ